MSKVIPFARPASRRDGFVQPATAEEFFQRYPYEIQTLLILQSEDRKVRVGEAEWAVKAALTPQQVPFMTQRIELELREGPWIAKFHRISHGMASSDAFFAEVRVLVLQLLTALKVQH